jgi:hypothetical protein
LFGSAERHSWTALAHGHAKPVASADGALR